MKARYLIALIPFALAGCQQLQTAGAVITAANALSGTEVTQTDLNKAVAAYDLAVLEPLNAYRYSDAKHTVPRPYCTVSRPLSADNFCVSYDVLAYVRPYTDKVEVATRDVQACIKTRCNRMQALVIAFRAAWADADAVKAQVSQQIGGAT